MKTQNQNIKHQNMESETKSLPGIGLSYSRTEEEVWAMLQSKMSCIDSSHRSHRRIANHQWLMAAAAMLVILLSTTAFIFFFTKTIEVPRGQHLNILLPDGSKVQLNAQSTIRYKPYWWKFNRQVQLEGEAFFEVKRGKTFDVISGMGRTCVLGTSFNILARHQRYRVTCYTGTVKVVSVISGESTVINSNEQAMVNNDGSLERQTGEAAKADEAIGWTDDRFIFTRTPINLVFEEVERQYNITIETEENLDYLYTGYFTKERDAEEVIRMICLSLNLHHQAKENGFVITKKTDP